MPDREAIVIGAGVVGLASTLALARRGVRVTVLERGPLLPAQGSSRGDARIRVLAAYPDDSYLELGLCAAAAWEGLEAEAGIELLRPTGAISWGDGIEDLAAALGRFDVPHDELDGAEVGRRFPGVDLGDCGPAVFQPDGATIRAERAMAALLAAARRQGAKVRAGETVLALEPRAEAVVVETTFGRIEAEVAVLAAGPWTAGLVPWPDVAGRLHPSLQTVSYFGWKGPPPAALIEYGRPDPYSAWSPGLGLKAADHEAGPAPDAELGGEPDPRRVGATAEWVARRFPGIDPRPTLTEACVYTNTPDERFLLERRGALSVVSACNGQGFQLAPAVGELVADLACG